jgi:hypothetical protein
MGRDSINSVLVPVQAMRTLPRNLIEFDAAFIQTIGCIFQRRFGALREPRARFLKLMRADEGVNEGVSDAMPSFRTTGVYIAGTCISAVLGFGIESSLLAVFGHGDGGGGVVSSSTNPTPTPTPEEIAQAAFACEKAIDLFVRTLAGMLKHYDGNGNTFPYFHVILIFLLALGRLHKRANPSNDNRERIILFTRRVPWHELARFLTAVAEGHEVTTHGIFPESLFEKDDIGHYKRLPEDFMIRGTCFTKEYFPSDFFVNTDAASERKLDYDATSVGRKVRLLRIGLALAEVSISLFPQISKV